MNQFSLFTAAAAAAVTVSALAVPASAASNHPFTDVGSRYDEAVSFLYEIEVINGLTATTFGTSRTLTRGDAAVILANMLMLDTENAPDAGFTDLNARVRGSVNALADIGVVSGVTKTAFEPGQTLSRGAMAKFLVTAFDLQEYAEQTPFTDVGGVFKPYIEALYGTGVTSGKTSTSYGTSSNITRGEFANLLYGTYVFVVENSYFPLVESVQVTSATQTKITLTESVPEEYTAADTADFLYFSVQYSGADPVEWEPASYSLSADRKTLLLNHANLSLAGKKGTIIIEDFEAESKAAFDFTAVTTSSSLNVKFFFAHAEELPATKAHG